MWFVASAGGLEVRSLNGMTKMTSGSVSEIVGLDFAFAFADILLAEGAKLQVEAVATFGMDGKTSLLTEPNWKTMSTSLKLSKSFLKG